MPEGGCLTIETSNVVVRHRAGDQAIAPGPYVMLAVSDNGVGMSPSVVAQALQPFFTTKEPGKGSGLGLSMVYGFVKQSGGYLTIDSKVGDGTSVKLYLPRAIDQSARSQESSNDTADLGIQGECILVVEDKRNVRRMAKVLLTSLGYVVLEAADAAKALALLQQAAQVHLLLTDILLTGPLSGFDLAREARRRRPELKVLFMSGYAESAHPADELLGLGLLVLDKPFTKDALARKVRQALAGAN
jgi:CheY-like chemotaxis protein